MKISYAEYLKRENATWALLHILDSLNVLPRKYNKYGPKLYFSGTQINSYITRLVEKSNFGRKIQQ